MASTAPSTPILNGNPIRNFDTTDPGATAWANDIKGGHHQYATIAERDAITVQRREEGMLCTVAEAGKTYRLVGTLENSGWTDILASTDQRTTVLEGQTSNLDTRLTSQEQATANGHKGYLTRTDLYADLTPDAGALAEVTNDPDPNNNGTYIKLGATGTGSWQQSSNGIYSDVATLKTTVAADIIPTRESIPGKAVVHMDENRREFMSHWDDGTTSLRLNADSIPTISLENLDADLQGSFPAVDDYNGAAVIHRDQNGRAFMIWGTNGKTSLRLADETVPASAIAAGAVTLEKLGTEVQASLPTVDDYNEYAFIARDLNGRTLWKVRHDGTFEAKIEGVAGLPELIAEVTAARGTAADLNARLSTVITPAGLLNRHRWGEWLLRSFGWKRTRLENAVLPTTLSALNIGDSWTQARTRLSLPLREKLSATLGGQSGGWYGFGLFSGGTLNGAADLDILTGSRSSDWTDQTTGGIYAIDAKQVTGVVAGSWIQVNFVTRQSRCRVHYRKQPGGGSFRWRINNDGAWTTVSTDAAAAYGIVDITLDPAVHYNIRIEVVDPGANGVIMNGLDTSVGNGVIVHKCGLSGGMCSNWTTHTVQAHFVEGVALLNPDVVSIMFATNEQNNNIPPATLAANMTTLIGWVRAAAPLADIVLMCPAANGLTGKTYTMAQYRDAIYGAAVAAGVAFLDYTAVFGAYSNYKYTGDATSRNLFADDNIHPSEDGAAVLADAFYRLLYAI